MNIYKLKILKKKRLFKNLKRFHQLSIHFKNVFFYKFKKLALYAMCGISIKLSCVPGESFFRLFVVYPSLHNVFAKKKQHLVCFRLLYLYVQF